MKRRNLFIGFVVRVQYNFHDEEHHDLFTPPSITPRRGQRKGETDSERGGGME